MPPPPALPTSPRLWPWVDEVECGLAAFDGVGVKPVRNLAPMWSTSKSTMEAIAAYGIRYDSSMFDDDRPYLLDTPTGRLAELPIHWCLDDWEQHIYVPDPDFGHIINRPSIVAQLWTEEFDAMRDTGSLAVLTCHPFCSGRPSRLRAIETFIDFAESCGEVSFRRADKLPEALLATPATALSVERIE